MLKFFSGLLRKDAPGTRKNGGFKVESIKWAKLITESTANLPREEAFLRARPEILDDNLVLEVLDNFNSFQSALPQVPPEFYSHRPPPDMDLLPVVDVAALLRDVFPRLKMRDGFLLDYVYARDANGAEPFLYARPEKERRLTSLAEYRHKFSLPRPADLRGDEPDFQQVYPVDSRMVSETDSAALFQAAMFFMLGRRFHLFDHSDRNNRLYLLTDNILRYFCQQAVGFFLDGELNGLRHLDPRPQVLRVGDFATVNLLTFEMSRGCSLLHVYFHGRSFIKIEDTVIARSQTGNF